MAGTVLEYNDDATGEIRQRFDCETVSGATSLTWPGSSRLLSTPSATTSHDLKVYLAKRRLRVTAVILTVLTAFGCSGQKSDSASPAPVTWPIRTPAYRVGDTLKNGGWSLTVRSVIDPYAVPAGAPYAGKPGTRPVAVDVGLTNTTQQTQASNWQLMMFVLETETGSRLYSPALLDPMSLNQGFSPDGEPVGPGVTLYAKVVFQIPYDAPKLLGSWPNGANQLIAL